MAKRFVIPSNEQIATLRSERFSKKTKHTDKSVKKLFFEFLEECKIEKESLKSKTKTELNELLEKFYASCKKKDGSDYCSSSLNSIRYSLNRVFQEMFNSSINIVQDPEFSKSKDVFKATQVRLKREGKAKINHTPVIEKCHLEIINDIRCDTPLKLQLKAWFITQFFFAKRGMENSREMKKDYFCIEIDSDGNKIVRPKKDELTKNHRDDGDSSIGGLIKETKEENCPVRTLEIYLAKLNPDNDALWQRPLENFRFGDECWFSKQPVGINTLAKFMKKLCILLELPHYYTNHSPRATAITVLGKKFEENDIKAISGHASNQALGIYKRVSDTRKKEMAIAMVDEMKKLPDCPSTPTTSIDLDQPSTSLAASTKSSLTLPDLDLEGINFDDSIFDSAVPFDLDRENFNFDESNTFEANTEALTEQQEDEKNNSEIEEPQSNIFNNIKFHSNIQPLNLPKMCRDIHIHYHVHN